MREEFEKLEEIKIHLEHGNVFFNEEKQTYASEFSALHFVACYVNGAWYAFQEQQEKIDFLESFIKKTCYLDDGAIRNSFMEYADLSLQVSTDLKDHEIEYIKELLNESQSK